MIDDLRNQEAENDTDPSLPSSMAEPGTAERANRLRQAVRAAGGSTSVAKRVEMPLGTLSRYLGGREMKAGAMITLAEATGVRLEWLASGAGPMRPGEPPPAAPPPPPAAPQRLAHVVDLADLSVSYEAALNAFATRGVPRPEARKLLALTIALYDDARAILARSEADHPQNDPQLSAAPSHDKP